MNYKKIIEENGYGKLADFLPEYQKGILKGLNTIRDEIDNFSFDYKPFKNDTIMDKIKKEIALEVLELLKEYLENIYDDYLIGFVDSNNYYIDENGVIRKEKEDGSDN